MKLPSVEADDAPAHVESLVGDLGGGGAGAAPALVASARVLPDEAYRTTVGTRAELGGWLFAEVQPEHHLDERRVAVDLLFSTPSA